MNRDNPRGLELARRFYHEAVAPILSRRRPNLPYAAALLGPGSEVLGFDDDMSRDHHWGPRAMIFLAGPNAHQAEEISALLSRSLPYSFLGFSTNFTEPDPNDNGTQLQEPVSEGPVRHRVEILSLDAYLREYLGIQAWRDVSEQDWLTLPQQKLLSLVSGEVFHDGLPGAPVEAMRRTFAFYPRNPWLYLMASIWARIAQEEHLMGRAGLAGDEVGSALIAARLVRDIMRLGFLVERSYAPYPKWFGTAFRQLSCGAALYPVLETAVTARRWTEREEALVAAYEATAHLHNSLGVTAALPEQAARFFSRPFRVMAIQGFAEALLGEIDDEFLTVAMRRSPIGGIDVVSDSTDLLEDPAFRPALRSLYRD